MPLNKAQGQLLSNDQLLCGLLENSENRIQLADCFPFFPVDGDSLRLGVASKAGFGADPLFDTVPVAVTEGKAVPAEDLKGPFQCKLLVQELRVNDFVAFNQSSVNDQVALQIRAAIKRFLYAFWKAFGIADETLEPQKFSGVRKSTPPARTIQTNDTTNFFLTLEDLSRLVELVHGKNGRPDVLWTNPLGYKNILKAYFDKGLRPEYVNVRVSDSDRGCVERPVLAFRGIPVYQDEFYPANESIGAFNDGTSIYAFVLGRGGLHGIVPAWVGKRLMQVRELLNDDATVTFYRMTWPVGLAVETRVNAIARLQIRPMSGTA